MSSANAALLVLGPAPWYPRRMVKIARPSSSLELAVCLVLSFMLPGCGGSQPVDPPVPHGGEGPTIPDATVAELRACAEKSKARLKESTYAFQFTVEVTEDGHAGRVRLKDSSPSDGEMESCMIGVLKDMQVPPSVVQALTPQAEAEAVSPGSRGLVGNPLAGGLIFVELVPVLVVAAGVTVIVGLSVYLAKEAIEAARWSRYKSCSDQHDRDRERCRKVRKATCWESAMERLAYCNKHKGETGFPPLNDD
jgi:hypothetical protein